MRVPIARVGPIRGLAAAVVICVQAGAAVTPTQVQQTELAPTGTLRVCINTTLVTLASVDDDGKLQGPFVDLAEELAATWGVGVEERGYRTDPERLQMVAAGDCDVVSHSLPAAPAAEALLDAAHPLVEIDLTYLVPPESPLRSVANVDRPGVRVAVTRGTTTDRVLSAQIEDAQVLRGDGGAALASLAAGEADALAGMRPDLIVRAENWPGARVLEGRFSAAQFGFAVPKNAGRQLELVNQFSDDARTSSLVQSALDRHGVRGVQVAATISGSVRPAQELVQQDRPINQPTELDPQAQLEPQVPLYQ